MKAKDGGVHHKRYNGCCMQQQVRIQKATWTSPILGRRSTFQASSCKASLMKDDVKVKVPNRTAKILILLDGSVNWNGVLKFGDKPKGDHAMHFLGWMERRITQSSVLKYS
jgi:hypothetical protein